MTACAEEMLYGNVADQTGVKGTVSTTLVCHRMPQSVVYTPSKHPQQSMADTSRHCGPQVANTDDWDSAAKAAKHWRFSMQQVTQDPCDRPSTRSLGGPKSGHSQKPMRSSSSSASAADSSASARMRSARASSDSPLRRCAPSSNRIARTACGQHTGTL